MMNPAKLFRQWMVYFPRSVRARALWLVLCTGLGVTLAQADSPNRAALVVVHGNGQVVSQCVEFAEESISGYELLERSGLDLGVELAGMGATVCRIDNEGCNFPADDCFCRCQGESCVFWIYWHLVGNAWQFSGLGASSYRVSNGDVEGWVWGEGSPGGGGAAPPEVSFAEVCAAPTKTPAPPTHTPTPTTTDTPTPTPEPTGTPTPEPAPRIHHFSADRPAIFAGETATLSWDLSGADAAYLLYNGMEEGVIAPGSKTVAPAQTTVYRLVARKGSRETVAELTLTVNPAPPTPTAAALPAAPALPPTATALPEPDIRFAAGASGLPAGACTTLYWEVQPAGPVFLDGVPVGPQGSQGVCPRQTQTYRLRAAYPGGERTAELTLTVEEAAPAAAITGTVDIPPTPVPTPTMPPSPAATPAAKYQAPTPELRPVFRQAPRKETVTLPVWARLGIWGGLAAGWCAITLLALVGWAGFWWLNRRAGRR